MLAIVLALIGALLFALGNVLQQRIAMGAGDELAHSPWFMVRLARSRVWLLGIAATLVGFVFHAAALDAGTLVVVQPTLALTLVFALPLGALLSRQAITRRDVGASIAITVGLVFFLILILILIFILLRVWISIPLLNLLSRSLNMRRRRRSTSTPTLFSSSIIRA